MGDQTLRNKVSGILDSEKTETPATAKKLWKRPSVVEVDYRETRSGYNTSFDGGGFS